MASAQPPTFGQLLKRYRTSAGLTQEALAERAGLSARGISDMERGLRRAPIVTPSTGWPRLSSSLTLNAVSLRLPHGGRAPPHCVTCLGFLPTR